MDPSEKERTYNKIIADSVLLSLFMRTDGKCNNAHAPLHRLKRYSAFRQNPIHDFLKDQNMKNIHIIQMHVEMVY